jgi:hypothetical protein|tara:strand:+ start:19788 stop:20168 length:381 start_codon:yes stop_codon:yes gene_type:complete
MRKLRIPYQKDTVGVLVNGHGCYVKIEDITFFKHNAIFIKHGYKLEYYSSHGGWYRDDVCTDGNYHTKIKNLWKVFDREFEFLEISKDEIDNPALDWIRRDYQYWVDIHKKKREEYEKQKENKNNS